MPEAMVITATERKQKKVDLRKLPVLARKKISDAEYPALYQQARASLRECCRIDELKDIKDKHEALAHYAKQAKDKALMYYAERIKLRAYERIGTILREFPNRKERQKVAKEQGLSAGPAVWAYDIAHIPKRTRDKLIEQSPPPKIRTLADYGAGYTPEAIEWRKKHPNDAANWDSGFSHYVREREDRVKRLPSRAAEEFFDYIIDVNECIEKYIMSDGCGGLFSMQEIARAVPNDDVERYRKQLLPLIERLDEFEQYLRVVQ